MRIPLAVAVSLASATTILSAGSAHAAPLPAVAWHGANSAAVQDDFNGDGYPDVAVGAPGAAVGTTDGAGAVVVMYGTASGVGTAKSTVITQSTDGIPGTPEAWDGFGATVTTADLDGDGYADLVVGTPHENYSTGDGHGMVTVVWGGPTGLHGGATVAPPDGWGEDDASDCGFGGALASGDMNGDGVPELAVGSRCEGALFTGPFTRDGRPALAQRRWTTGETRGVVMGDVDGDGHDEVFWLGGATGGNLRGTVLEDHGTDNSLGNPDTVALPLAHGWLGQVGDVNGDGYGDLVTGAPDDSAIGSDHTGAHLGGEVEVLYGGPGGLAGQAPQVVTQDTAGVPGSGEAGDYFGASLSVADVNGDHRADVLVGTPGEAIGTLAGAGAVTLLHGSAAGLTGTGAVSYTQNTTDVPGSAEAGDGFGAAVHLADTNHDGHPDVVVGIPGEDTAGCVWDAAGSAAGPVLSGSANHSGPAFGITSLDPDLDGLGAALGGPHVFQ